MRTRCLIAFLASVTVTAAACASLQRVPAPNWERYQEGQLAGFLHAPGERVVSEIPEIAVRRVRGRLESPFQPRRIHAVGGPAVATPGPGEPANTDVSDIDPTTFVVELRGPRPSGEVRTLTTRSTEFDFGPLSDGTYTLKATSRRWASVPGWEAVIRTVVVSDHADPAAQIRLYLDRLDSETGR